MDDIIELDRRFAKAVQSGRGIRLSDEELDLLVSTGSLELLTAAATKALAAQAAKRQQEREEIRLMEREGRGREAAELSMARLQEQLRPRARVSQAKLRKQK